jgi:predicted ferric reductase
MNNPLQKPPQNAAAPESSRSMMLPAIIAFVVLACAGAIGLAAGLIVVPQYLPDLTRSIFVGNPKAFWYLSRASGFVAFILMWLSNILGLGITAKLTRLWNNGPTFLDLHEYVSLLCIGFALFHIFILLGDAYIGYQLAQLVIPFNSPNYQPLWVGIGQVMFYLTLIVTFTFYIRNQISYRAWRLIHYLSFLTFVGLLLHSIFSGSDSGTIGAMAIYWVAGISMLWMTVYRILTSRAMKQAA